MMFTAAQLRLLRETADLHSITPSNCPNCEYDRRFPQTAAGGWIDPGNNGPVGPCPLCNADAKHPRDGERGREARWDDWPAATSALQAGDRVMRTCNRDLRGTVLAIRTVPELSNTVLVQWDDDEEDTIYILNPDQLELERSKS